MPCHMEKQRRPYCSPALSPIHKTMTVSVNVDTNLVEKIVSDFRSDWPCANGIESKGILCNCLQWSSPGFAAATHSKLPLKSSWPNIKGHKEEQKQGERVEGGSVDFLLF